MDPEKKRYFLKIGVLTAAYVILLGLTAYLSFDAGLQRNLNEETNVVSSSQNKSVDASPTDVVKDPKASSTVVRIKNGSAEVDLDIGLIPGVSIVSTTQLKIVDPSVPVDDFYRYYYPVSLLKLGTSTPGGLKEYTDKEANIRFLYPTAYGELQHDAANNRYFIPGGQWGPRFAITFSSDPSSLSAFIPYFCQIRLEERRPAGGVIGCFNNYNKITSLVDQAIVEYSDNDAGYETLVGNASIPPSPLFAYGHPKFVSVTVVLQYPTDVQTMLHILDSIGLAQAP